MAYASRTAVPVTRSRAELDALLEKHGASRRALGHDEEAGFAFAVFEIQGRQVRLRVPLPRKTDYPVKGQEPRDWHRLNLEERDSWRATQVAQLHRERWRQLLLLVKAKLEAVQLGLSTFEREFLADIFLANGRTVHEEISANIAQNYIEGGAPKLLGM